MAFIDLQLLFHYLIISNEYLQHQCKFKPLQLGECLNKPARVHANHLSPLVQSVVRWSWPPHIAFFFSSHSLETPPSPSFSSGQSERPRTPVDYFIVNMSVSDLLIPLFTIPRRFQEIYLGWSPWLVGGLIGDLLCRVINFTEEMSFAVSMLSMIFIAVERFWSVVYPLKLPLITKKTSPRFVAFSWVFAILTFSYYFVAYKLVAKNDQLYSRYGLPQVFDTWQDLWRADRIMMFVIYVAVPFVILTILYTVIVVSLHQQEKRAVNLHSHQQRRRTKENKQITLMLACWRSQCCCFSSHGRHITCTFLCTIIPGGPKNADLVAH